MIVHLFLNSTSIFLITSAEVPSSDKVGSSINSTLVSDMNALAIHTAAVALLKTGGPQETSCFLPLPIEMPVSGMFPLYGKWFVCSLLQSVSMVSL